MTPEICDDQSACTDDDCDPYSGCTNQPINGDDYNPCTFDDCDPKMGIVHVPGYDGEPCEDGLSCSSDETCADGAGWIGGLRGVLPPADVVQRHRLSTARLRLLVPDQELELLRLWKLGRCERRNTADSFGLQLVL